MHRWLRGKPAGLIVFVVIACLVAGGLGWATAAALRLEREQLDQRKASEHAARLRLAMWRLDSSVSALLAHEDGRPFNHYSAVYAPPLAFNPNGGCWPAGDVMEPSPLLGGDLPQWMRLHFQVSTETGWVSPQVPGPALVKYLTNQRVLVPVDNVTKKRKKLLSTLRKELPTKMLLKQAREHAKGTTLRATTLLVKQQNTSQSSNNPRVPQQTTNSSEYLRRLGSRSRAMKERQNSQFYYSRDAALNLVQKKKAEGLWSYPSAGSRNKQVLVELSSLVPIWARGKGGTRELLLVRLVRVEDKQVCQGIALDAEKLQQELTREVADLFPQARIVPAPEHRDLKAVPAELESTMTALPFRLDTGPFHPHPGPTWTALRVGLLFAWAAALVALAAVGLGGWTLLNLSERQIRFVSAVTHELRTPLTTFRLYLDMLLSGMVRDDKQRDEYVQTLHTEADRLHRLVANVLDYARLERQHVQLVKREVPATEILDQLAAGWHERCECTGKELVIENTLPADAQLTTDPELVQQILGNLVDNACKYSQEATDPRLWLRVRREGKQVIFEVEDRGPGVPRGERRCIFRAFRRGRRSVETTGGVGLGLGLAYQWARLLGGKLTLQTPAEGGACFSLRL